METSGHLTQVHQSYGYNLRLPLETERRAEAVIDEGPGHLNHLVKLGLVALQTLGVLQQWGVGVVHLQVELDGLQEDSLQGHHLFPGVLENNCNLNQLWLE